MAERSRELKATVISGNHAGAERAMESYVEAVRNYWEALSEQERAGSPVPARASELLGWAREMTIIQRSLAADQLSILHKASRYEIAGGSRAGLQVKG